MESIVLSCKGSITAFDVDHHGINLISSSPGSFLLYKIENGGVPSQVIYYEQPGDVNKIKINQDDVVATLRSGSVSFWNPLNPFKPLSHVLPTANITVRDFEWNSLNSNFLGIGISGLPQETGVLIWDMREQQKAVQALLVGGRYCSKISFSNNYEHLVAALVDNRKVVVFDRRMGSSDNSPSEPVLTHSVCQVIDGNHGFNYMSLCHSNDSYLNLLTASGNDGLLQLWHASITDQLSPLLAGQYELGDRFHRHFIQPLPSLPGASILTQFPLTSQTTIDSVSTAPSPSLHEIKLVSISDKHYDESSVNVVKEKLVYRQVENQSVVGLTWVASKSKVYSLLHFIIICFIDSI
jgi:WD40 repeat protein